MAEQTIVTPHPTVEDATAVPSNRGFAPQVSTHPVTALTLGRQNANDADKSNYFEN
ncbi:hypothetical protein [Streptomyces mobaraensis]|uniref:hypothetical protein n=1 Tax=Streptomyces mobaraensis TaxID=35621 RepID=UPI0012AD03DF|nr:hypothetical protein [Streptomyces mobaraensis]